MFRFLGNSIEKVSCSVSSVRCLSLVGLIKCNDESDFFNVEFLALAFARRFSRFSRLSVTLYNGKVVDPSQFTSISDLQPRLLLNKRLVIEQERSAYLLLFYERTLLF